MQTTLNKIREHSPCACGCGQPAPLVKKTNARLGHVKGKPLKFVSGHNKRVKSSLDLLMKHVGEPDTNGCWNWIGAVNRKGYGSAQVRGVKHNAHRAVYLESGLQIPVGYHLDHICRNKLCVNPAHMEPVTLQENVRRQHAARTEAKLAA